MIEKKNKLMLIISAVLVAGFLFTSLASYFVSRSSLISQIEQSALPLTSDNIYSEIQRDLLRPIFISSLMASDTFLRDWVLQGETDPDRIIKYLKEIQTQYNAFTSFFVSERTKNYYHPDGILKTIRPDEERDRWYYRLREMASDYEINVDPDLANKDAMTIFINYRVYDYDGNYIGATGVGLTVNAVNQLMQTYQRRYGRNIYFVDDKGDVTLRAASFPGAFKNIYQAEGVSTIVDQIMSSENGSFRYARNGKTVHLNTRYIQEFKWRLVVEQTEEKVVREIIRALVVNLLICAVITTVVLLLTNMLVSGYRNRIEKLATTDKLTGLYNRHAFDIILGQAFKETRRSGAEFSIILFDVDHFKQVNDAYGHLAGDEVLQNIASAARRHIRSSDILCRWGGEEFIALLKDCALQNAFEIAENVRKKIQDAATEYKGQKISVTISSGVVQYRASEEEDDLLIRVDNALYDAKINGRNMTKKESVGA